MMTNVGGSNALWSTFAASRCISDVRPSAIVLRDKTYIVTLIMAGRSNTPANGRFAGVTGTLMGNDLANLVNNAPAFQVDETTLLQNSIVHLFLQFNGIDSGLLF